MAVLNYLLGSAGVLLFAYLLDALLGDPRWRWHPIRVFGDLIHLGIRWFNKGTFRFLKGGLLSLFLVVGVYVFFKLLFSLSMPWYISYPLQVVLVFFGLANRSLMQEGKAVLDALKKDLVQGRHRLAWIVGRDTGKLSKQQVISAVFETLSENLSDGVIAPMFYYALLGLPGMMAYKMINTLDSMMGYKNKDFERFGKLAARLDDVANYVPARMTAFLMLLVMGKITLFKKVFQEAKNHTSPNAGFPEAALACLLEIRLGGGHYYKGVWVAKPYIGRGKNPAVADDFKKVCRINWATSLLFLVLVCLLLR